MLHDLDEVDIRFQRPRIAESDLVVLIKHLTVGREEAHIDFRRQILRVGGGNRRSVGDMVGMAREELADRVELLPCLRRSKLGFEQAIEFRLVERVFEKILSIKQDLRGIHEGKPIVAFFESAEVFERAGQENTGIDLFALDVRGYIGKDFRAGKGVQPGDVEHHHVERGISGSLAALLDNSFKQLGVGNARRVNGDPGGGGEVAEQSA